MAEREGFEPPIDLRLCLISSQVHSTGLCHLSAIPTILTDNVALLGSPQLWVASELLWIKMRRQPRETNWLSNFFVASHSCGPAKAAILSSANLFVPLEPSTCT